MEIVLREPERNQDVNLSKSYVVEQSKLEGVVRVSGAKNNALRLLAATLLTSERVHLTNYPASLVDARFHVQMLEMLGKTCVVDEASEQITVTEERMPKSELKWEGPSIRNTLLILGALVARTGYGAVPLPGGCNLGENRRFDLHEMLLEAMGARVWVEDGMLCAEAPRGLHGADLYFPVRSSGATENALLCASVAEGSTRIWNPHMRPEIFNLIEMLRAMGAHIEVFGSERFEVSGAEALRGVVHDVVPDDVEALTWMIGALMTEGEVEILDFPVRQLEIPLIHLRESGVKFLCTDNRVVVRGGKCYPVEIAAGPYPALNTDMQPLIAGYGACANGMTCILDPVFVGRYAYAKEMGKMGLRYEIHDNLLKIHGGTRLKGAEVVAHDLRTGAVLALAGLVAEGETVVHRAWQIDRGYHRFEEKLKALGGRVHARAANNTPDPVRILVS